MIHTCLDILQLSNIFAGYAKIKMLGNIYMPHKLCRSGFSGEKISKFWTPDILIWYIMKYEVQLKNSIMVYITLLHIPMSSFIELSVFQKEYWFILQYKKNLPQPRTQDRQADARLLWRHCFVTRQMLASGKDNSVVLCDRNFNFSHFHLFYADMINKNW